MLVHGDTLDHRPREAGIGNQLLARADLLDGPHFAIRNMVQGVHDVGRTGLPDVGQRHRIIRPIPTPRLFA